MKSDCIRSEVCGTCQERGGSEKVGCYTPSAVFAAQYVQAFRPDGRREAIYNRLRRYYRDTPDSMGTREALPHWQRFRQWAAEHRYTYEDINRAKRDIRA